MRMFTIMMTVILLAIIFWFLAFQCMGNDQFRVQLSPVSRAPAEDADPLALLNQAVDDGVASIQNAKFGLDNYRVLIFSVQHRWKMAKRKNPAGGPD